MGGSALLIYGHVNEDALKPTPLPRSLADRVLGRVRTTTPTWSPLGHDRRMVDLPADALKGLDQAFRDHVRTRCNPPWTATASLLQYLELDVVTTYLRGDANTNEQPEWYAQVTFSGCAGMSEVSSELSVHWAERWVREHGAELAAAYLKPCGFEPNGRVEPLAPEAIFVPAGIAGYARVDRSATASDPEDLDSPYFEIDAAAMDTLDDGDRAALRRTLEDQLLPTLPAGACCCQFCAPNFDAAACDRLVPFR